MRRILATYTEGNKLELESSTMVRKDFKRRWNLMQSLNVKRLVVDNRVAANIQLNNGCGHEREGHGGVRDVKQFSSSLKQAQVPKIKDHRKMK